MRYEIIGKTVPAVEFTLNRGESIYSQRGGMTWQTDGINMKTNARGGVMKSLGRMFTGESIFMNTYTANVDGAKVAFATTVPGDIVSVNVGENNGFTVQKSSFLCAEPGVDMSIAFTKKFSAGLFGGEGFVLQKGNGMLFLEVDGDPVERILAPGEVLKVDTGNVVGFESTVSYEIETVKGLGNIFLGGEGLFLTKLVGPGRVIIQSQNFGDFAGKILGMMPKNNR